MSERQKTPWSRVLCAAVLAFVVTEMIAAALGYWVGVPFMQDRIRGFDGALFGAGLGFFVAAPVCRVAVALAIRKR